MEGLDYDDEEDYVPKSEKRTQWLKEEADKEKDLMEKARNSKIEHIWGKGIWNFLVLLILEFGGTTKNQYWINFFLEC